MRARAVLLVLLLGAGGCPGRGRQGPSPRAPAGTGWNVVLLTIDTLRADHLGAYGYSRRTSPHLDALAGAGVLFEQAYSYWPKTRGSFVAMLTGRRDSQTGYGKANPVLLDFNPTLATVLKAAGYTTAAAVDNGNVGSEYGYHRGFDRYRETWKEKALATETDRSRAITDDGIAFVSRPPARPFFLWLHYVSPHAPYTPPAPYDTAFLDGAAARGPRLPVVRGYHGGIPAQWVVPGRDRLGYYVAQYDGEIAAVDAEVGRFLGALAASDAAANTMVVVTSDHGESLGEHGYYFDHGEDLFDPSLRVPLIVRVPGGRRGVRAGGLVSTLDLVPTILDAVKVSYPPDLAGRSLLRALVGPSEPGAPRLAARNDRNLSAVWDSSGKIVAHPTEDGHRLALYDRAADPGETRDVARERPDVLRPWRREMELFVERHDRERARTEALLQGRTTTVTVSPETCALLKTLGYVTPECPGG